MAQVWFKGFNIGRTIKAKCLVLSLMFLKHLGAVLGLSSSNEIFCRNTNTSGGVKIIPKLLPVPSIMFLLVTDEGLIIYGSLCQEKKREKRKSLILAFV